MGGMRSRLPLTLLVAAAAALVLFSAPLAALITDLSWFRAYGLEQVFLTTTGTQLGLALGAGLAVFAIVFGSANLAIRNASGVTRMPRDLAESPIGQWLLRTPMPRLAAAFGLAAGAMLGLGAASWWDDVLKLLHAQPFGHTDPVWGLDASFYVFTLPVLLEARSMLLGALVLGALGAAAVYIVRGSISVQLTEIEGQLVARGLGVLPAARRHLAGMAASILLVMAVGAYLRRYTLMYDQAGLFAGPGYSDLNGTLPLLTLQAVATAIAAIVAYFGIERLSTLGVFGAGGLVVLSSALTSVYPGLLQRFNVLPNELNREGAQIIHHIEATRLAFGVDTIEELPLSGDAGLTLDDIERNRATVNNVRLWDHGPLLDTFSQVQEIRTYYDFQHVDNDRYMINGELRQIMLSPRELLARSLPAQARTWVNETMTYTHGYGIALGPVNQVTAEGLPELFVYDLPPKVKYPGDLDIDHPEIYYGESIDQEVFVKTDNPEFDYPAGDENKYTTYIGGGGVQLDGLNRYLFALRLGSTDLLFSGDINSESRILLYRNIMGRAQRVAPFLRYDGDPYLVILDGHFVWVLDAYTTTDRFPYAKGLRGVGNYMRNSVKITVDALDGKMNFYNTDPDDPILAAWAEVFPDLFQPAEAMSDDLRAHIRYPQDFFTVQSTLFATYHMREHQVFYNREDEWEVPVVSGERMAPYYTIMKLPGEEREEFILMLPFSPAGKPNLSAWMVARSDGDAYGEARVYKFPKEKMVYGPKMIVARINQDDAISEKMSLWNQQGSEVEMGTLLVIPIEESLIYVQPLYLRAESESIPELKRVIVAYENRIAMQSTLEEGLAEIFGTAPPPPMEDSVAVAPMGSSWQILAVQAQAQYAAATEAQRLGDWARYGAELEALGNTIAEMQAEAGLRPVLVEEPVEEPVVEEAP